MFRASQHPSEILTEIHELISVTLLLHLKCCFEGTTRTCPLFENYSDHRSSTKQRL